MNRLVAPIPALAAIGISACAPAPAVAPAATTAMTMPAPWQGRAVDICAARALSAGTLLTTTGVVTSGPGAFLILHDSRGRDCPILIDPGAQASMLRSVCQGLASVTGRLRIDEPLVPGAMAGPSLRIEQFSCR